MDLKCKRKDEFFFNYGTECVSPGVKRPFDRKSTSICHFSPNFGSQKYLKRTFCYEIGDLLVTVKIIESSFRQSLAYHLVNCIFVDDAAQRHNQTRSA